jgi:UDP-N-acetylmuramate--alanine ligase
MTGCQHFIGIGGAGMSGLARLLLARGVAVQGSDQQEGPVLRELRSLGARIFVGHRAEHVRGASRVVYSAAVPVENPELIAARAAGIPTLSRAALLGEEMAGRRGIAVAGTHGKTTTTAMTASIFLAAGLDPTVLVGGDWQELGGNARPGAGPHFIAEACEAFNSFLELRPSVALVTNVEADHLDCHGSLEGVRAAFAAFLRAVAPDGYVVGCAEDEQVRLLLKECRRRTVTCAVDGGPPVEADYTATEVQLAGDSPSFLLRRRGRPVCSVRLGVPGRHNVLNALCAAAVALEEGLSTRAVTGGLEAFRGVGRRFERLGEARGVLVLDDYAHHPTEIRATLAAARAALPGRQITAVFQPHLYSRTRALLEEFAGSFGEADRVVITEIYPAREEPLPGVDGALLARSVSRVRGGGVEYRNDLRALPQYLADNCAEGAAVLLMGAGNIRQVGEELVAVLREAAAASAGTGQEGGDG